LEVQLAHLYYFNLAKLHAFSIGDYLAMLLYMPGDLGGSPPGPPSAQ